MIKHRSPIKNQILEQLLTSQPQMFPEEQSILSGLRELPREILNNDVKIKTQTKTEDFSAKQ